MIKLANGITLEPIIVLGEKSHVMGKVRDVLTFVFEEQSMDALDNVFTAENCASIIVVEEENEYSYENYVIRAGLEKKTELNEANEYVTRIHVKMAQKSLEEIEMEDMRAALELLGVN